MSEQMGKERHANKRNSVQVFEFLQIQNKSLAMKTCHSQYYFRHEWCVMILIIIVMKITPFSACFLAKPVLL